MINQCVRHEQNIVNCCSIDCSMDSLQHYYRVFYLYTTEVRGYKSDETAIRIEIATIGSLPEARIETISTDQK